MIAVFFHIWKVNNWETIYREIYDAFKKSKLIEASNLMIDSFSNKSELYEFPTLRMLHYFSKLYKDYFILYVHTKGVSKPGNERMDSWRRDMIYNNIENWAKNIENLNNYDTIGIRYRNKPSPHWSGNFWWARSDYVATLPDVEESVQWRRDIRFKAEAWLFHNNPRYLEIHNVG
ncbi:MAG: hypothetical protein IMZ63_00120 [Actinobacteria bacterium]|nr:hypothetical protein [Actinomycetota bacterium]